MWIILVSNSLQSHRDDSISSLLGEPRGQEYYLSLGWQYMTTSYIGSAKIYVNFKLADKLVKSFYNEINKKDTRSSKFYYINGKHLSIRKLTRSEWDGIVDKEISNLDRKYSNDKGKLLDKKNKYKV